jgi:hypothetical protein
MFIYLFIYLFIQGTRGGWQNWTSARNSADFLSRTKGNRPWAAINTAQLDRARWVAACWAFTASHHLLGFLFLPFQLAHLPFPGLLSLAAAAAPAVRERRRPSQHLRRAFAGKESPGVLSPFSSFRAVRNGAPQTLT